MKNYYDAKGEDAHIGLPMTFHIKTGTNDPEYIRFKEKFDMIAVDQKSNKTPKKSEEEIKAKLVSDSPAKYA
jgi:hypothetical protein